MRSIAALAACAAVLVSLPAAAQHTLEDVEINGPTDNRIDFLIMGDGYTAAEQDALLADAESMADAVFGYSPFTPYRPFFNFYAIQSVSAESGADNPSEGIDVDTAFGCFYDCMGMARLICCDDEAVLAVADDLLPEHDAMVLMVNAEEYGGSGGYFAVVAIGNEWAPQVVTHEFGHSLGWLGDEYEDPYPGFEFTDVYPNISPTADRDALKWTGWVDDATPLPTPESAATGPLAPVGAYEGACYQSTDLFRPVSECFMRNISNGFCPVCAEALVLSYYGFVEIIDSSSPAQTAVSGATGETIELSIDAVEPVPSTVAYDWILDGTWDLGHEATASLPIECLTQGAHDVVVEVRDESDLVISDPESLLEGSRAWTVTRADDGAVEEDCFEELPTDTDSETDTGGDAGTDADGGAHHEGDDGCGCASTGRARDGSPLLSLLALP